MPGTTTLRKQTRRFTRFRQKRQNQTRFDTALRGTISSSRKTREILPGAH